MIFEHFVLDIDAADPVAVPVPHYSTAWYPSLPVFELYLVVVCNYPLSVQTRHSRCISLVCIQIGQVI